MFLNFYYIFSIFDYFEIYEFVFWLPKFDLYSHRGIETEIKKPSRNKEPACPFLWNCTG